LPELESLLKRGGRVNPATEPSLKGQALEVASEVINIWFYLSRTGKRCFGTREHVSAGLGTSERAGNHALVVLMLDVVLFAVEVQSRAGSAVARYSSVIGRGYTLVS
jgi:hypothetical protein